MKLVNHIRLRQYDRVRLAIGQLGLELADLCGKALDFALRLAHGFACDARPGNKIRGQGGQGWNLGKLLLLFAQSAYRGQRVLAAFYPPQL